jgi:hypothetical protein
MNMAVKNYTLGRGKVYFYRFKTGTQLPEGFAYIGNTPEFSLTIESENLDHYSSDAGIREKDDSVPLEVTRTGSFITDDIQPDNVALFFFGSKSVVTQEVVGSGSETFADVVLGRSYKLGVTESNPTGYMGINELGFSVAVGSPPLVEDVDYTMDFVNGIVTLLPTATSVIDGDDVVVTYSVAGSTRDRVISGSTPVEGAMMYVANNPKGDNLNYYLPYVKITPNGDYALKGDEWQQIPFSIEALKPTNGEAIYMDGVPTMVP